MSKSLNDIDWVTNKQGKRVQCIENTEKTRELLNSTGCGMCLAKFRQVTMHLGTGMTHSCHHPIPHKIPLEELERSPAALFNTGHLKHARRQMLNDEKPPECDYCWRVEGTGGLSDRHFKSAESWALDDHDEILKLDGTEDIYPSYLEVSFSNACNLRCSYCGPEFSSKWVAHLKELGPLKILEGTEEEQWVQGWQDLDSLNYKANEENPYIDAFWKWFPEASKHLKHYRITGGEPLMSKETFRSMEHLIANPNPELEFSVNSNFSVPEKLWTRFIHLLAEMKRTNAVKKITVYTSIEAWGKKAEYGRYGMDVDLVTSRYEEILKMGDIRCTIMSAFNIFSITSIKEMFEWVLEMKQKYNVNPISVDLFKDSGFELTPDIGEGYRERAEKTPNFHTPAGIDIPYLRNPSFLDVRYCTPDLVDNFLIPAMDFMAKNTMNPAWNCHQGFDMNEVERFKRIIVQRACFNPKDTDQTDHETILKNRAKFYNFVYTKDQRDGTNFLETFPEMEHYYTTCKEAYHTYMKRYL